MLGNIILKKFTCRVQQTQPFKGNSQPIVVKESSKSLNNKDNATINLCEANVNEELFSERSESPTIGITTISSIAQPKSVETTRSNDEDDGNQITSINTTSVMPVRIMLKINKCKIRKIS